MDLDLSPWFWRVDVGNHPLQTTLLTREKLINGKDVPSTSLGYDMSQPPDRPFRFSQFGCVFFWDLDHPKWHNDFLFGVPVQPRKKGVSSKKQTHPIWVSFFRGPKSHTHLGRCLLALASPRLRPAFLTTPSWSKTSALRRWFASSQPQFTWGPGPVSGSTCLFGQLNPLGDSANIPF